MRTVFETIAAAFSMFSALPVPCVEWTGKNTRWLLAAFPLVGTVIGGLCWGWVVLCGWLSLPDIMRGAGLTLIPVLVTGGIHLDGYADIWDALSSHAPPEKKQEILQDPAWEPSPPSACAAISQRISPCGPPCPGMMGRCFCSCSACPGRCPGCLSPPFPWRRTPDWRTISQRRRTKEAENIFVFADGFAGGGHVPAGPDGAAAVLSALCVFVYYSRMAKGSSAGCPGIWPGGFCRPPSCGCWGWCV